jgi:hypothetical protein
MVREPWCTASLRRRPQCMRSVVVALFCDAEGCSNMAEVGGTSEADALEQARARGWDATHEDQGARCPMHSMQLALNVAVPS